MTEFDQLIREKAEQAQYPYKPSAWKSFAKRAGIKTGMSAWQIATVTIASLAVVGSITLAVVKHYAPQPAAEPEPVEIVAVQDTVETVTDENTETVHAPKPKNDAVEQVRSTKSVPVELEPEGVEPAEPVKPVIKKAKVKPQRIHGRPVTISADTITQMVPTDEELRKGNSRIF